MEEIATWPAVGTPVIQRVLLCDQYRRDETGLRSVSSSLPGHLIQLMLAGRTAHEVSGRRYILEPGHLIWYHEDEIVRIHVVDAPWVFYTLNFIAPALTPPRFEDRVRRVGREVEGLFQGLLDAWRNQAPARAVREMRVQAALLNLLATVWESPGQPFAMDPSAQLWWELETRLRRDLSEPVSLRQLADLAGRSAATVARSCYAAVGMAPMRRIKQVRLSLARGLVQRSDLRMTQIAARVGYQRVHEFSRDYRRHFGLAPTEDRAARR